MATGPSLKLLRSRLAQNFLSLLYPPWPLRVIGRPAMALMTKPPVMSHCLSPLGAPAPLVYVMSNSAWGTSENVTNSSFLTAVTSSLPVMWTEVPAPPPPAASTVRVTSANSARLALTPPDIENLGLPFELKSMVRLFGSPNVTPSMGEMNWVAAWALKPSALVQSNVTCGSLSTPPRVSMAQ